VVAAALVLIGLTTFSALVLLPNGDHDPIASIERPDSRPEPSVQARPPSPLPAAADRPAHAQPPQPPQNQAIAEEPLPQPPDAPTGEAQGAEIAPAQSPNEIVPFETPRPEMARVTVVAIPRGPIFLDNRRIASERERRVTVPVPPGTYRFSAGAGSRRATRTITVEPGDHRTVELDWLR
jgi:hypothetical protein